MAEAADLHLRPLPLIGMPGPGDHRHDRDGGCHAQIGNHLPIIAEGKGDDPIKHAENNGQHLSDHVPFGDKNQGRHPDQGGGKRKPALLAGAQESRRHSEQGTAPKGQFKFRKILNRMFYSFQFQHLSQKLIHS